MEPDEIDSAADEHGDFDSYYRGFLGGWLFRWLRSRKPLANASRRAARSEFERAARSGTLRAPPTTTPPKPAEATLGFSSTRKTIDNSPGWRYSSDQKKRLFKFPIRKVPPLPTTDDRHTNA
jgi:hypothetical protein